MCFIAEYCTPFGCLYIMATKHQFAGLQHEDMKRQGKDFVDKYKEISKQVAVKDKLGDFTSFTQVIYYEGKL